MSLKEKVAIVTGSSRGIGRAIALKLAEEGANVAVTYHSNQERAEEVVEQIEAMGRDAIALQIDVRKIEDVLDMFSKTIHHLGQINIVVNNAAGSNIFKPNAFMTLEEYDSMFDITRGVYFALQEAAKRIADGGKIINISTGLTSMAMPASGGYAGSKAAVEQFSRSLAVELGNRQITVNTVSPGITDTDGSVLQPEQENHFVEQTPLKRLGKPDDIARVVAFLASDNAGWITGQNIRATGGII